MTNASWHLLHFVLGAASLLLLCVYLGLFSSWEATLLCGGMLLGSGQTVQLLGFSVMVAVKNQWGHLCTLRQILQRIGKTPQTFPALLCNFATQSQGMLSAVEV